MGNVEMWALIVGFFVPPVLAIIQQPGWSPPLRAIVGFVVAIIVALGTIYFAGNLDFSNQERVISTVLLLFVTSISTYKAFWAPTAIAPKIEHATSKTAA